MRIFFISMSLLICLFSTRGFSQESSTLTREDKKSLPITSYFPDGNECKGIAIVSPGAGGSEKGYEYIGESMSAFGYFSVVVGHQESGRGALRAHIKGKGLQQGLSNLITEPEAYRGRFMDIAAAKEWAAKNCAASESILIGHSMGAATAMIEAGALNNLKLSGSNSFDIYIALSPQGSGAIFPKDAWSKIQSPFLTLTGTRDDELGGASWKVRTEPYRNMPKGCKWLGIITGATHMNFAGNGMSRNTERLTTDAISSFINGIHSGNCNAVMQKKGIEIESK